MQLRLVCSTKRVIEREREEGEALTYDFQEFSFILLEQLYVGWCSSAGLIHIVGFVCFSVLFAERSNMS